VTGCRGDRPAAGKLYGKVTYRSQPLTDAEIHLRCRETGVNASAPLDTDGRYSVAYPVRVGTYQVTIIPPPVYAVPGQPPPTPRENPNIPKKYRSEGTSGLTVTVKEGKNEFNVDMTD
jgi:hypothetical protein